MTIESFLFAIRERESSGNYQVRNQFNYIGAYQFGEVALVDLGVVNFDRDIYDNNYSGGFTGKFGINSVADFLNTPSAQDAVVREWFDLQWSYIKSFGLDHYAYQTLNGYKLSHSGMLAAAHLLGITGLQTFVESGGTQIGQDQNGTLLTEYITLFERHGLSDIYDTGIEGPNTIYGGRGRDVLKGHGGNDMIDGNQGDDDISGGAGDDTLRAGTGDDIVRGGDGDDQIFAGNGADYLIGEAGRDTFTLNGKSYHSAATVAYNISSANQMGTGATVSLAGKVKLEVVINGGSGTNTVYLGAGGDAFFLHDAISDFHHAVTLTRDSAGSDNAQRFTNIHRIFGMGGDDVIDLTSPDYSLDGHAIMIDGGEGRDVIWGSAADETIHGGAGNDTLFGGIGKDVLYGGPGSDVFEFTRTSTETTLADFDPGQGDRLRFYNVGGARFDPASVGLTDTGIHVAYVHSGARHVIDVSLTALDTPLTLAQILAVTDFI